MELTPLPAGVAGPLRRRAFRGRRGFPGPLQSAAYLTDAGVRLTALPCPPLRPACDRARRRSQRAGRVAVPVPALCTPRQSHSRRARVTRPGGKPSGELGRTMGLERVAGNVTSAPPTSTVRVKFGRVAPLPRQTYRRHAGGSARHGQGRSCTAQLAMRIAGGLQPYWSNAG